MTAHYHIRYLRRRDIDLEKWDACINLAPNGLIYGHSWYLDYMTAGSWDALVLDDYSAIMPLTWRRKWAVSYCCQPAFTQQLGIFTAPTSPATSGTRSSGPHRISTDPHSIPSPLLEAFLAALGRRFRFSEIFLNHGNAHPSLVPQDNFILPLNTPYETLAGNYKKDLVKNLKEAARSPFQYITDPDLRQVLSLFQWRYQHRTPHTKEEMYTRFEQLCIFLRDRGQLLLRAITGPQNELLATALLPRDARRIYLLQSTVLPAGRTTAANHFLLDSLIREFAGQPIILDFEGSEIPGIAHFYSNFGATNQPYYFYRNNRLPWPLRTLK